MKYSTGLRMLGILAIGGLMLGGCGKKTVEPTAADTEPTGLGDPTRPDSGDGFNNPNGDFAATGSPVLPAIIEDPADGVLVGRGEGQGSGFLNLNDPSRDRFEPVYFGFNQSTLSSQERLKVESVANFLMNNQNSSLIVEGHCDWKGTTEYNISLGERRASSVKEFLLGLGVAAHRVSVSSQGDLQAAEDADSSTMARDRKARFILNEG
jgi:peptidoglycan-associated lipoprotein